MQCIRPARMEDLAVIEALVRLAYAPYVPRIGRQPAPMQDDYAALIQKGQAHVLDADGRVQGALVLIPEQDAMLLDNIAVLPEAQGKGFGRRLLDFAENTAREAGFHAIRLYTNEAMTENIALYSRIGYTETHRIEENGLRRVYMRKALA
jgi:ribosomal protein S18 acetylase RimI-like enzyme